MFSFKNTLNYKRLTPPLFIEVSLPIHVSERSCIFVLEEYILALSTNFHFDFGVDPTIWYFFSFHYFFFNFQCKRLAEINMGVLIHGSNIKSCF